MLVLAVDTSTPAVTAGLVTLDESGCTELVSRLTVDARAHAELLTPHVMECFSESGRVPADLDAVVVGVGPGPFTGLRVGMATAAAFADALQVPVYGICSLDAIAHQVGPDRELLVVTDARRREVYWARYRDGVRVEGPAVAKPNAVDVGGAAVIAGSPSHVDLFDVAVEPVESPSPLGLVAPLATVLLAHETPEPIVPLYLRRPDAVEQAARAR